MAEQGNSVQGKLDVPVFDDKPENTAEQWKLLCEGLDKLGKVAADMGMVMTYHHQMGTLTRLNMQSRLVNISKKKLIYKLTIITGFYNE